MCRGPQCKLVACFQSLDRCLVIDFVSLVTLARRFAQHFVHETKKLMTRQQGSWLVAGLLFAASTFSIILPSISALASLVLSGLGAAYLLRNLVSWATPGVGPGPRPEMALYALIMYAVVICIMNVLQSERWGAYHVTLAIVLMMPGYVAFRAFPVSSQWLWRGSALGACAAFGTAIVDVFVYNLDRAGDHVNPIPFGNIALVLAVAALLGLRHIEQTKARAWLVMFQVAGALGGVGASLLSGTKGSWPALILVAYVAYRVSIKRFTASSRYAFLGALAVLVAALLLQPQVSVVPRLKSSIIAMENWVATDDLSYESVGHRLEMWKFGLAVAGEKPWFGFGKPGMIERKHQAILAGASDPRIGQYVTLHNEFLNMWVTKGLLGVLVLLGIYVSALRVFWGHRRSVDSEVRTISYMGICLVAMYLTFGLWEVAFQLNIYRNTYLFWTISLLGMLGYKLQLEPKATPEAIKKVNPQANE